MSVSRATIWIYIPSLRLDSGNDYLEIEEKQKDQNSVTFLSIRGHVNYIKLTGDLHNNQRHQMRHKRIVKK